MALWGTLLGAMTLGRPGDRFGSRDVLKFVGVLYLGASLGAAFAWDLPSFLVFRFLTGIAIGGSSVLAPARQRGAGSWPPPRCPHSCFSCYCFSFRRVQLSGINAIIYYLFAASQGAVIWVYLSAIFPKGVSLEQLGRTLGDASPRFAMMNKATEL